MSNEKLDRQIYKLEKTIEIIFQVTGIIILVMTIGGIIYFSFTSWGELGLVGGWILYSIFMGLGIFFIIMGKSCKK